MYVKEKKFTYISNGDEYMDGLLQLDEFWEDTRLALLSKYRVTQEQATEINLLCSYIGKADILERVKNRTFEWGIPRKVYLNKAGTSKKRIVYMFEKEQRVLLGVLYRALSYHFRGEISSNCFSYKKGISTIKAVSHLLDLNNNCDMYGVKLDIHAYFNSVSSDRLQEMIGTVFKGYEDTDIYWLISTLYSINKAVDNGVVVDEYMSLIPGTAVASFFANYCLKDLDQHFADFNLPYARYSDDIILFARTPEEIESSLSYIKDILSKYGLEVNPRKYEYFNPKDKIDFLGLTFDENEIDIHKYSFEKVKAKIRKDVARARKRIEQGKSFESEARKVIHRFNYRMYKCYIEDRSKFGWGYYAFRYVTTDKTLREIDFYFRDKLRYLKTGKYNKANINKTPDSELHALGYVSTVMMYNLFKIDFDAYCDRVSLLV